MADLLKGNEDQQKAIILNQGPALILAGPGSGKTFTIVERIHYLITHHGVHAENILVITFTKAAARQMRERFQKRMGGMACPVNFGTFHAIFYHILQTSLWCRSDTVLSEKEKREYLQRVLMTLPIQRQQGFDGMPAASEAEPDFPADKDWEEGLLAEFGYLKNAGCMPDDFQSAFLEKEIFKRTFLEFQRMLAQEKKLDFDDFAAHCLQLFQKSPDILRRWQEKFLYILVDEFQDINPAQYKVVKLLAGINRNLFVVGDDDQSIYGFRASDPKIMKQFLEDFPEAKQILLSVNYRCPPGIVDLAGRLIHTNKERFDKQIRSGKKEKKTEGKNLEEKSIHSDLTWEALTADRSVWIGGFQDRVKQAAMIADTLLTMAQDRSTEGEKVYDAAVIFRTNTGMLAVAEAFSKAEIPFFLQESVKSPYEHFVCQDLLAYLRFVYLGQQRADFFRIMNRPSRYISRQAAQTRQISWNALLEFYKEKNWMHPYIRRFAADTARIGGMDLYAAVHYIRRGVGYDEWILKNLEGDRQKQAIAAADFFKESVRGFPTLEAFLEHIKEYEKKLEASNKSKGSWQKGKVALLTMHGAKGLEFESVFLPDCNEGVTPHKKSMKADEVEEERRMFYVGMTRAKEKLYISWIAGNADEPGFPSRFLGDIGYRKPWRNTDI